jgi:hypothetical protein
MPKFMAPSARGLTLTAAEGERRRYRPSSDFGSGAGSIIEDCQETADPDKRIYLLQGLADEFDDG